MAHLCRFPVVTDSSYYSLKLLLLVAILVASTAHLRWVVASVRAGVPRLLLVLPILVINVYLPNIFDDEREAVTNAILYLYGSWIANFKALAFALQRGALIGPLTPLQMFLVYSLPVTPQLEAASASTTAKSNVRQSQSAGTARELLVNSLVKIALTGVTFAILPRFQMPSVIREHGWVFCTYWLLAITMDVTGAIASYVGGMTCSPHFDKPYISTSLTDWWSRRWNLVIGNVLRATVYDPICEGRLVPSKVPYKFSKTRAMLATCTTFIVSGIAHELLLYLIEPKSANGRWFAFFAVMGPLVIAESIIVRWGRKRGLNPPRAVRVFLTIETIELAAHFFWWPIYHELKLPQRLVGMLKKGTLGS